MKYKQFYLKSITAQQPGDAENYIIRGVFSTSDEDRQGDVVVQEGWLTKEYLLNPVVLFAHDHWQPAVGKMIELGLNEEKNLAGAIQFAAKEYDFAMVLYKLYAGGYMRAFSAGFDAIEGGYDEFNDTTILTQNILYEVSCVNVGANARALAVQAGIDISPLVKFQEKQLAKRKLYHQKGPACRQADETKSECVSRKIGELVKEGYEQTQAEAIAYSVCEKPCEAKQNESEREKNKCEIKEKLDNLEKAIRDLARTPTAIKQNGRQPSKEGKKILVKTFNRAIVSLLKEKRKLNKIQK
jgi:hypothetical protein